jgi:hypothetical protein
MNDWRDLIWKVFFGMVIIFFGGAILGGTLNLMAAANPTTASLFYCPKGKTAILNPDPDQRDPLKFPILCTDQNGVSLPSLPASQSLALQRRYFYMPSYVLLSVLVTGWIIRPFIQKATAKNSNNNSKT